MLRFLANLYAATWLWLPVLTLFLVQGLRCPPSVKLVLFKIELYYIVAAIGLQLLLPTSHLILRVMLFDLTTRAFLFIQAAEILWNCWNESSAPVARALKRQKRLDDDDDEAPMPPQRRTQKALVGYALSALLYLGWMVLGVLFAFTLTPGM